jgi:hypothetical protein
MTFSPELTCREIREISEVHPEHAHLYFSLASGDRLDRETSEAIIDWVDGRIVIYLECDDGSRKHRLFRPPRLLQHLRGWTVLETLQDRRGSEFERHLTVAACRWADNTDNMVDHEFEAALSILLRIGGDGFTEVVNALLKATSDLSKLKGCQNSLVRPNAQTAHLLSTLAQSDELWGKGPGGRPFVQQKAIDALAVLGEDIELIRAVVRWGRQVSIDLPRLMRGHAPMSNDDIVPALSIMSDPSHERYSNAILAAGFTGREDLRAQIKNLFLGSATESDVALSSMFALEALGGQDPDIEERLLTQYRSGHHKFQALRLMVTGDEEEIPHVLAAALPDHGPFDEIDHRIIGFLGARTQTRALVKKQLDALRESGEWTRIRFLVDLPTLLDPSNERDEQELWEMASQPGPRWGMLGTKAGSIKRLAEVQPDAAFELAHHVLVHDQHERANLSTIMLEIDSERALPLLIDHAVEVYSPPVCRDLALRIRERLPLTRLAQELEVRLHDGDSRIRTTAACISGYLGSNFLSSHLRQVVFSDGDRGVCYEAASALRRQQREAEAVRLLGGFTCAEGQDAWSLADEIIHLADPRVLSGPKDHLGFLALVREAPNALQRYVWESQEKIDKETDRDLESHANRWD